MKIQERFQNVYIKKDGKEEVLTENLDPGHKVYGEKLVNWKGKEYRVWDPTRSKLSTAILKGIKKFPIRQDSKILYLGTATGTTCSHLSDVVKDGLIYGVDVAPRVMRDFLRLCKRRKNLIPILADARKPTRYSNLVEEVDTIYVDVAQRDQASILIKNAELFLRRDGFGILMIKARSVDVTKKPSKVYSLKSRILQEGGFKILEKKQLDPFQKDHAVITGRWSQANL